MSESDYFFQVTGELGVPYGTFILTCKLASISTSQVDPKISHRLFSQLSPAIFELSPQPFRRLRLSWVSSIWQAMATWDLIWLDVWVNRLVYLQQQKCAMLDFLEDIPFSTLKSAKSGSRFSWGFNPSLTLWDSLARTGVVSWDGPDMHLGAPWGFALESCRRVNIIVSMFNSRIEAVY